MRIEIGYGLEGAIPDAIAKRITSEQIKPYLQRGDYDGGIAAGITGLMKAARGEYQGTGGTVGDAAKRRTGVPWPLLIFAGIFIVSAVSSFRRRRSGTTYSGRGRSGWGGWPIFLPGSGGGGGGGSWGGGGGGGGFSGGGGSFGGGGASDSWYTYVLLTSIIALIPVGGCSWFYQSGGALEWKWRHETPAIHQSTRRETYRRSHCRR